MTTTGEKILEQFSARKIILPVLIGFGVLLFFFIRNFDRQAFSEVNWTWLSFFWMLMALGMMAVRQFFYMWRIRYLTDYRLSWKASFDVIFLWEFSSAATPSAVGGTAVALFLLAKEKINAGKSIALVLCTVFLDMTFLLLVIFLALLFFDSNALFPGGHVGRFNEMYFIITFGVLGIYTVLVAYGLFGKPEALRWLMVKAMSLRWLKRWQHKAEEIGNQLVDASAELQQKDFSFWAKTFLMTGCTWSGRFLVANCLIMAVTNLDGQLLLYVRQFALMVMLMLTPTPGGSGVAEISFPAFISDMVESETIQHSVTALWRISTYYFYLFAGLMVLPRWVRRVFAH